MFEATHRQPRREQPVKPEHLERENERLKHEVEKLQQELAERDKKIADLERKLSLGGRTRRRPPSLLVRMDWPASNESEAAGERRASANRAASPAIAVTGAVWRR